MPAITAAGATDTGDWRTFQPRTVLRCPACDRGCGRAVDRAIRARLTPGQPDGVSIDLQNKCPGCARIVDLVVVR